MPIWILCGVAAAIIGARKGEGCFAFFIGVLFGPFGILFAVLSKGNRKACPYCKELINKDAKICPHCRMALGGATLAPHQMATFPGAIPHAPLPPPGARVLYRIARNGEDLGELPITTVKQMLAAGQLSMQDYYFDTEASDWMQLDCLAALV